MPEQQNIHFDKVYNIKGLAWMLKTTSGTSSACSNNSSHIDQQFKIFKLKDQKKKWKKKINKKFESVGEQIETVIRHRYSSKQPFDINFKKNQNPKHIPHLKQGKMSLISNSPPVLDLSRLSLTISQKSHTSQKSFSKSISQKQNTFHHKTMSTPLDPYNDEKKLIDLRKVFGEIRHGNLKVQQSKNIMRIHSQQKEFLDKNNQQFFKREMQWIDNKVEFYNQFDIKEYERDLIQKKCQEKQ